jgi:hypothetical protein
MFVDPCTGFIGDEPRAIPFRCDRCSGNDRRRTLRRWPARRSDGGLCLRLPEGLRMVIRLVHRSIASLARATIRRDLDDPTLSRAIENSGMPASSLVLTTVFHASIIFVLLWSPPTTSTPLMPEDVIEVTIERQTPSVAAVIQPPAPVPQQPVPQMEPPQTPTLEKAIPEPEPMPEPTFRDFPKVEQKKSPPKSDSKPDPKPDSNKVPVPPPGATTRNASPPTPPPNQADVDPSKINERAARMWGTKYFERMGIRPSHQATLTGTSGRACPLDPEPYKLEITNNKFTVTNDYGIMFSITVPADGEIYQLYKRPPMAGDHIAPGKWMEYKMIGNVKTGKLVIWAANCVYTLNPN